MFTLITPVNRRQEKRLLRKMFDTREGYYSLVLTEEMDRYDTPQTLYVAYEDPAHGVFGSCRLNALNCSPVAGFYETHFPSRLSARWLEVSLVSFEMETGHPSQEDPRLFDRAIQDFYQGLSAFLETLSREQGYGGYMTCMDAAEHEDLPFFGGWQFQSRHTVSCAETPLTVGEVRFGSAQERAAGNRMDLFSLTA